MSPEDEARIKAASEFIRTEFSKPTRLLMPVQPLDKDGNPDGPLLTTWEEWHAKNKNDNPIGVALDYIESLVKEVMVKYRAEYASKVDTEVRQYARMHLMQLEHHASHAAHEWRNYQRVLNGAEPVPFPVKDPPLPEPKTKPKRSSKK